MKLTLLALLCAALTGCAFSPQKANITPTVSVMESGIGQDVTVAVRITDERPKRSLGRRGTAYGPAAEITPVQDLAVVIQNEVLTALKKKTFSVADFSPSAPVKLTVEVRLLEYSTSTGFWTGGVHVQAALKAVASNRGDVFEKMFRSEKEERVVAVPTAATNEAWINERLSDVLNQMLNDSELMSFLAQK